jgi:hypothetical protein
MRLWGIEAGGFVMWPILALVVPGLVVGILALGLSSRRARQLLGIVALFVSAASSGLAIGGALSLKAKGRAAEALVSTQVTRQRVDRAVAIDARVPLRWGLGSALVPLLGGLTGALSSRHLRRLRRGKPASVRSMRDPRVEEDRRWLAWGAALLASGGAIGATALLLAPLPPPNLPIDSPAWGALEALDLMKSGASAEACEALERAAKDGGADPSLVPEARAAATECFEMRLEVALQQAPDDRVPLLRALIQSPMPYTEGQRRRASAELGSAGRSEPPR